MSVDANTLLAVDRCGRNGRDMIRNLAPEDRTFTSNAFLVDGEQTVLVDPGSNFDVVERVERAVDSLDAIVLTHTHPDHVGNTNAVSEAFDADVWGYDPDHPLVDHGIDDEDEIRLGDDEYRPIHTPGHKDDHLCFYADDPGIVFVGDLVFAGGGFGRTDLEEGDRSTLVSSIERLLAVVDGNLRELYSGHGPPVTDDPYETIELAYRMARK